MANAPQGDAEWTLKRLREWTEQYLRDKGCDAPAKETRMLMAHVFGCPEIQLIMRQDEVASQQRRAQLRELIRRRAEGCPTFYLVGHREFFSLDFEVDEHVLIPRPDSEWIVYECLRLAKEKGVPCEVLDLGTGSGNLAVAIAHQYPQAEVTAIDLSAEALEVAKSNAEKNKVADHITFLEGDLFEPVADRQFDFIVSNPPYIRSGEMSELQKEVRDFEPHMALDGGADGFAVLDRIFAEAAQHLKPGGALIVEMGYDQAGEAKAKLEAIPDLQFVKTIRDGGGIERALLAKRIDA